MAKSVKKKAPAKKVAKPAPKKSPAKKAAAKPAAKKVAKKTVKKAAKAEAQPKKKVVKAAAKPASKKPVAKKAVAKAAAPKKTVAKAAATKPAPKKVAKPVAKLAPKKAPKKAPKAGPEALPVVEAAVAAVEAIAEVVAPELAVAEAAPHHEEAAGKPAAAHAFGDAPVSSGRDQLPRLVIVGRPNVGKSSLMNRLASRKISIVDPTAGVTRDRVETIVRIPGEGFGEEWPAYLMDTGGYGIVDRDDLGAEVERQIGAGLAGADLILFVMDAQEGVTALDEKFARVLRESRGAGSAARPVMVVANKVDADNLEAVAWNAAQLGFGDPVPVSAETRWGLRGLHEAIRARIDFKNWHATARAAEEGVRVAVVGKRNAGKSTLVNALAGEERVIVSEIEGTTRDSVDVRIEIPVEGQAETQVVTLIDTAGVRKTKSLQDSIEFYSQHRSLRSVRRADVCLFLVDATLPISNVDLQLINEVNKHHRPTVIVVNKWDLVEHKHTTDEYTEYLDRELKGLSFAPIVFVSAKKADGVREALGLAINLYEQARHRVSTSELNDAVQALMQDNPPKNKTGKQPKIYYATQVEVNPPTIQLNVNDANLFDRNFLQFLDNHLRDRMPWSEVPIKVEIKGKLKQSANERVEARAEKRKKAAATGLEGELAEAGYNEDHLHHASDIEADDWEAGGEDYGAGD